MHRSRKMGEITYIWWGIGKHITISCACAYLQENEK